MVHFIYLNVVYIINIPLCDEAMWSRETKEDGAISILSELFTLME